MKLVLIGLVCLLSGCVLQVKHKNTVVWVVCYQDDNILPNGTWQSSEIAHMKCNKRNLLQFRTKIGERLESSDPLGFAKGINRN